MELLNKIQRELKVPKSQFNAFAKYNYRNCEDILEAVKPLLGEGVLTLSDEVMEVGGRYYVKATATLKSPIIDKTNIDWKFDYEMMSVTAYAREQLDKKGMDEAQITGAASSYARKYALCGLFAIDDGEDADKQDNSAGGGKQLTPEGEKHKAADARPLQRPASAKPTTPTKTPAQVLKEKKQAIRDLLDNDPTTLSLPSKNGEDYKVACLDKTGFELNDDNVDLILKSLLA